MGGQAPAPPPWQRTVTSERNEFEAVRRQAVLTLPNLVIKHKSGSQTVRIAIEVANSIVKERSTWVVSMTTVIGELNAESNIEATPKFDASGVLKIEVR